VCVCVYFCACVPAGIRSDVPMCGSHNDAILPNIMAVIQSVELLRAVHVDRTTETSDEDKCETLAVLSAVFLRNHIPENMNLRINLINACSQLRPL